MEATDSWSETSTDSPSAPGPPLSRARTAPSVFASFRAAMTTLAPAREKADAMPRPMPPLPPVTTATLPLRSNIRPLLLPEPAALGDVVHKGAVPDLLHLVRHGQQRGVVGGGDDADVLGLHHLLE